MNYIIYKNGRYTEDFIYVFSKIKIEYFVSKNELSEGELYKGKPVYSMKKLAGEDFDGKQFIICDQKSIQMDDEMLLMGLKQGSDYIYAEEMFSDLNEEFIQEYSHGKQIAIWGVGNTTKMLLERYASLSPEFFIDSDESKKGSLYNGRKVLNPNELDEFAWKNTFVIVASIYYDEIKQTLDLNGLTERKDYIHFRILDRQPSEILKTIINAPRITSWQCTNPFRMTRLLWDGSVFCCHRPNWVKFAVGNAYEKNIEVINSGIYMKLFRLSVLNGSYSLCHKKTCMELRKSIEHNKVREYSDEDFSELAQVSCSDFDDACNLYCESCRHEIRNSCNEYKDYLCDYYENQILPKSDIFISAGNGEVFLSKYYKRLLTSKKADGLKGVIILSNGLLGTREKWNAIFEKYKNVVASISIDAATEATYEMVRRGGKYKQIFERLIMLGEFRKEGKLDFLVLNYVVQRCNYKEVSQFVEMSRKIGADAVNFLHIDNWGTYSEEKFAEISMFDKNGEPNTELKAELSKIENMDGVFVDECFELRLKMYECLGCS